jgi:hypothetical protein
MRNRFLFYLVASLILFLVVATPWTNKAQEQEAGKIEKIDCAKAYWRKTEKSKEDPLTQKDEGKTLYVDEGVRCVGKGVVRLIVYGQSVKVDDAKGWYNLPENNAGDESGTGGRPHDEELTWMTGTYRLNEAESDVSASDTQFFRQAIEPLWHGMYYRRSPSDVTPLYFAFKPEDQRLTFASSETPPLTFSTDGRMVTSSPNGRDFQRVQATAAKDNLNITWVLNDFVTALVNIRPVENGKKLIFKWIVRAKDSSKPQEFKLIYDRVSSVADLGLHRRQESPVASAGDKSSNAARDVIVAELLDPISMKPGSPTIVRLRVLALTGSQSIISLEVKTEGGQTVPGSPLVLQFRGIREADGRVERFVAILEGVVAANGDVLARKSDFRHQADDPTTIVFRRDFEFPAGARFLLRKP